MPFRARIAGLKRTIASVIGELSSDEMAMEYPEVVLERVLSTQDFLIRLYGHLNWHLGQVDYARRILHRRWSRKAGWP